MSKNNKQKLNLYTLQNICHYTLLLAYTTCGTTFIRRKRIKHKVPCTKVIIITRTHLTDLAFPGTAETQIN